MRKTTYYHRMKNFFFASIALIAVCVAFCDNALARDESPVGAISATIGGKLYHNLELVSVTDGIALFNSLEGPVSAPWASFSLHSRKPTLTAKDKAKLEAESPTIRASVIQVLQGGVLADRLKAHFSPVVTTSMGSIGGGGGSGTGGGASYERSGTFIFVEGITGLAEGEEVKIRVRRNGVYNYRDTEGASRTVEKWKFIERLRK